MERIKYLLCFLLLSLCANVSYCLTRGEIREQIRSQVRDTDTITTRQRWSDSTLNTRINIAQSDVVAYTRCLYGRWISTPSAGVQEYALPSDCVLVDRVSYLQNTSTTSYKKLAWQSQVSLDRDRPSWETGASGLPTDYYIRAGYIGLYPRPSSTYAINSALKIEYYKTANDMTNDSDEPFDSDYSLRQWHSILITAVAIMCKKDEGKFDEASMLQAEYATMLNIMREYILLKPDKQGTISIDFK